MATDPRKHTVPADAEGVDYRAINNLGLTVRDAIPVSGATEQAQVLAALAGLTPPIVPSTSNPVYFYRTDLGFDVRVTGTGATAGLPVITDGVIKTVSPQVNIGGTLASALDLAAAVTVPARPFGASRYAIRIHGKVCCSVPPGRGGRIDAFLDNALVDQTEFTNGGSTECIQTFEVDRTVHLDDESTHTARVVITPLAGGLTVRSNESRVFEVHVTRRAVL